MRLAILAAAQAEEGGIIGALGIDWQMLILQLIAFLVLVWLSGKYIYPVFVRIIDERQRKIEAATRSAAEVEKQTAEAKEKIERILQTARQDAAEILRTAKQEAEVTLAEAESAAKTRADEIIANAHDQLNKEVALAQRQIRDETLELVKSATKKVLDGYVDSDLDERIIRDALREVR